MGISGGGLGGGRHAMSDGSRTSDDDGAEEPGPSHVVKMADGGMVCAHCGGEVGEDGESYSEGGEMEEVDGAETEQDKDTSRLDEFARMTMKRGLR